MGASSCARSWNTVILRCAATMRRVTMRILLYSLKLSRRTNVVGLLRELIPHTRVGPRYRCIFQSFYSNAQWLPCSWQSDVLTQRRVLERKRNQIPLPLKWRRAVALHQTFCDNHLDPSHGFTRVPKILCKYFRMKWRKRQDIGVPSFVKICHRVQHLLSSLDSGHHTRNSVLNRARQNSQQQFSRLSVGWHTHQ